VLRAGRAHHRRAGACDGQVLQHCDLEVVPAACRYAWRAVGGLG
jgi:hypothetical protein